MLPDIALSLQSTGKIDVSRADMALIVFVFCILRGTRTEVKKKKPEPVISAGVCLLLLPVPAPEVSRESIQQLQKDRLF